MKINASDAAALGAVLRKELQAIAQIEAHVLRLPGAALSREQLDSLGFALHNAYNALENSFTQISLSFENHIKDPSRWHRELLEKMLLDIPPLRPQVLSPESRPLLADLLGFRHVFRHAYDFTLDERKTMDLWRRWQTEGAQLKDRLRSFAEELAVISTAADASDVQH